MLVNTQEVVSATNNRKPNPCPPRIATIVYFDNESNSTFGCHPLCWPQLGLAKGKVDPLTEACRKQDFESVKRLVESGIAINDKEGLKNQWPLLAATSAQHLEIARYLLEQGANVGQQAHVIPQWTVLPRRA